MRKMQKSYQKEITTCLRAINKAIEEDSLWHGRFVVRQRQVSFYPFSDGSGGECYFTVEFIDKKTGSSMLKRMHYGYFSTGWRIASAMNEFIVKYTQVWENEGREALYSDDTDYTKIKENSAFLAGDRRFNMLVGG